MTSPKAVNGGQTEREAFSDTDIRAIANSYDLDNEPRIVAYSRALLARAASTATATDGEPVAYYTDWPGRRVYADKPHTFNDPGMTLTEDALADHWRPLYTRAAAPQGLTDERILELDRKWGMFASGIQQIQGFARDVFAEQSAAPQKLCSICHGYGRYQDGDSGTEADGYAPNIVECECSPEERFPRASEQAYDPLRTAVESMVCMLENGEWAEHASTYKAPGDKLAARLEAAITDLHNELSGDSEQADEAVTERPVDGDHVDALEWHWSTSDEGPMYACGTDDVTESLAHALYESGIATFGEDQTSIFLCRFRPLKIDWKHHAGWLLEHIDDTVIDHVPEDAVPTEKTDVDALSAALAAVVKVDASVAYDQCEFAPGDEKYETALLRVRNDAARAKEPK